MINILMYYAKASSAKEDAIDVKLIIRWLCPPHIYVFETTTTYLTHPQIKRYTNCVILNVKVRASDFVFLWQDPFHFMIVCRATTRGKNSDTVARIGRSNM